MLPSLAFPSMRCRCIKAGVGAPHHSSLTNAAAFGGQQGGLPELIRWSSAPLVACSAQDLRSLVRSSVSKHPRSHAPPDACSSSSSSDSSAARPPACPTSTC
eukprot:182236-Rhodomonas_salina.2